MTVFTCPPNLFYVFSKNIDVPIHLYEPRSISAVSLPSSHSMNETFELPVFYNGEEILLSAQLHQYGYAYKIEVEVNGTPVFFERDDERKWRALVEPSTLESHQHISIEMLQAIADSLQQAFE